MVEVSGISILLSGWMIVDLGGGGWLGVLLMEIGNSSNALRCNSIDSV